MVVPSPRPFLPFGRRQMGVAVGKEDAVAGVELHLGVAVAPDPAAARRDDMVGHQVLGLGQHPRHQRDLGCALAGGRARTLFGEGVCGIERPPPVLRRNRQTRCGVVPGGQPTTAEPSFQSCDAAPQAAPVAAPRSAGLVAQRVSLWGLGQ